MCKKIFLYLFMMVSISCSNSKDIEIHKVKKGETLSGIAVRYDESVWNLNRWNNLKDQDVLSIGQKIKIHLTPNSNTDFINKIGGNKLIKKIEGYWKCENTGEIIKFKKDRGDIFLFSYFSDEETLKEYDDVDYWSDIVYLVDYKKSDFNVIDEKNYLKDSYLLYMNPGCPLGSYGYNEKEDVIIYLETGHIYYKK